MNYEDVILYKAGLQLNSHNEITPQTKCQICPVCWNDLKKNKQKIPSRCVANKMWLGDIPKELENLTIPEQHLISLYRHNQCIMKFESVFHSLETQQSKLKGNCISVNMQTNILKLLMNYKLFLFIVSTKYVQYCNFITFSHK